MKPDIPVIKPQKEKENLPTVIQGTSVGSKEEARMAVALDRARLDYEYQYSMFEPSGVAGEIVLDFLVHTKPKPTPVAIQGSYWHTGAKAARTQLQMATLAARTRGQFNQPKEVWDYEIPSVQAAYTWVTTNLGVG